MSQELPKSPEGNRVADRTVRDRQVEQVFWRDYAIQMQVNPYLLGTIVDVVGKHAEDLFLARLHVVQEEMQSRRFLKRTRAWKDLPGFVGSIYTSYVKNEPVPLFENMVRKSPKRVAAMGEKVKGIFLADEEVVENTQLRELLTQLVDNAYPPQSPVKE